MEKDKEVIRIDLTPKQQEQLKAVLGRDAQAIELSVSELEARIAPMLAANHNETLLA